MAKLSASKLRDAADAILASGRIVTVPRMASITGYSVRNIHYHLSCDTDIKAYVLRDHLGAVLKFASDEIRARGDRVTYVALVEITAYRRNLIQYCVDRSSDLRRYVFAEPDRSKPFKAWVDAADALRRRGIAVTHTTLADELDIKESRIKQAVHRRKSWRAELGILTETEARQKARLAAYQEAARPGEVCKTVTQASIARKTMVPTYLVTKDFVRVPALYNELIFPPKKRRSRPRK